MLYLLKKPTLSIV